MVLVFTAMKGNIGRHEARKWVIESLYQFDLLNADPEEMIEKILKREGAPETAVEFARALVRVVKKNLEEIDRLIGTTSDNWALERISYLDRAILRMAVGEMLGLPEIPYRVSISEAVELAKEFSTQDSGGFVNGILDSIAESLGHKERK